MRMFQVTNIADYISRLGDLAPAIYRGQGSDWPLLPGVIRSSLVAAHVRNPHLEKNLLERFRLRAASYLPSLEDTSAVGWWRCMALAQHHGLPTRLLDWTYSPLTALFFALDSQHGTSASAIVYAMPIPEVRTFEGCAVHVADRPWKYERDTPLFLQPDITQPRIAAQASVFSVHPGSPVLRFGSEVYELGMERVEIPGEHRADMARGLYRLGVHRSNLFPEPDAVSATIMWEVTTEMDRLADDVLREV